MSRIAADVLFYVYLKHLDTKLILLKFTCFYLKVQLEAAVYYFTVARVPGLPRNYKNTSISSNFLK